MRTILVLLVAALVAIAASAAKAASSLELPAVPPDRPNFSAADNLLQSRLVRLIRTILSYSVPAPASFELTLHDSMVPIPVTDLIVGRDALLSLAQDSVRIWQVRPSFDLRAQWDFLRREAAGPGPLERLANLLEVQEIERPWSTTTSVHLLAAPGPIIPYAAIAREIDVDEDIERYGLGAGAMFMLGRHASIGAELMYFGGERTPSTDDFNHETRFVAHLQIEF